MQLSESIMTYLRSKMVGKEEEVIQSTFEELSTIVSQHIQLISKENKLESVFIPDILYIVRDTYFCEIVTAKGKYRHCMNFELTQDITKKFNFDICDNRVLVNLDQIKKFDGEKGRLYFVENVEKNSLYASASNRAIARYRKLWIEKDISIKEVDRKKGISDMKNIFGAVRQ